MPRLRLDPTSPSGVSIEPEVAKYDRRQQNGYVVNNATGLIKAGTNVTISGNGTQSSPYQINSSGSGSGGTTLPADATGWLHDDGAGTLAWSVPSKSDVGLGNVDNTSDATKNSATATLTNKDLSSATNTFPTLNQDTTGKSAKTDALNSATTTVNVSSATAPSSGQVLTATSSTAATWQTPTSGGMSNPMTTLGDMIYEDGTPIQTRLAGNTTTTKKFLTQTGTGTTSAAPSWGTIVSTDIPTLNQNTTGTAANVTGTVVVANGGTGATTLTGLVKGNGTSAMTAATAGTDYSSPSSTDSISGTKTFADGTLKLSGSASGATTLHADTAAIGNIIIPSATDTLVGQSTVDTLTNKTLSTGSTIDANVTVTEVLKKVYPIGSIYTNATDSTNPATLLGFGTWSAFAAGRVPVGKASTGTFATIGATGGEETHTLTAAEQASMPIKSTDFVNQDSGGTLGGFDINGNTTNVGSSRLNAIGGGGAHNNLQPYIVVYMWKRTA